MLLILSRLIYSAISSSRGGQAAQIEAGGISNITLNPQPVGSETSQIGNVGITQPNGTKIDVTETSSATMLQKLEAIRAVLADGDGVNIAIQNMDVDLDNLETILNGSALAENGVPTYVTNDLINNIKTAVEKLDNAIITLGQAVGTAEATLVAGTDGANLRGLLTDSTGKLQVDAGPLQAQSGIVNIGDVSLAPSVADGATLTSVDGLSVGGKDSGGNFQMLDVETNGKLNVVSETATDFNVTEANSTSIKTAVENLDNTVNGNNQLDVNIADGGFDGVVTNTVLTSLDDAINASRVDVNIAAGGFDGAVTNAANTQLAVTTVQSTFDTGQNSQVGSTARVQVKSASQALQSGITVVASSANTASVFLGDSQVENSGGNIGFELAAGAGFTFSLSNANLLYAISASGTQTINFVAM